MTDGFMRQGRKNHQVDLTCTLEIKKKRLLPKDTRRRASNVFTGALWNLYDASNLLRGPGSGWRAPRRMLYQFHTLMPLASPAGLPCTPSHWPHTTVPPLRDTFALLTASSSTRCGGPLHGGPRGGTSLPGGRAIEWIICSERESFDGVSWMKTRAKRLPGSLMKRGRWFQFKVTWGERACVFMWGSVLITV